MKLSVNDSVCLVTSKEIRRFKSEQQQDGDRSGGVSDIISFRSRAID